MSSIRDVANHAGVSTATVARVLSGGAPVSEELSLRVKRAVAELRYVPSAVARNLSRGRTDLIGLLVSDIGNPFAAQVARGLGDAVSPHGYNVVVGSSQFDTSRESALLTSFASRTVDAVALVSGPGITPEMQALLDSDLPLVFVDRRPAEHVRAPVIRSDNLTAAGEAVNHLTGLGHRDLAMISGPAALATASQRVAGFRAACAHAGLQLRDECVREGFIGIEGGEQAMYEVLDLSPRPTAVFSFNNLLAVGALRAMRERGLRFPDDLSFITFDDMDLFPYVDPPITAIAQPAHLVGMEAGRTLLRMLQRDPIGVREVVLNTEFRMRLSCGPPPS